MYLGHSLSSMRNAGIPPLRFAPVGMTELVFAAKNEQLQRQKQIPPLRCGMTNKVAAVLWHA
jgi:hypothetical protein